MSISNAPTYTMEDVLKEVRVLGRDAAAGGDSLPRLALRAIKAAADGVMTLDKAKGEPDHAEIMYREYLDANSKKAQFTKDGMASNAAKVRVCAKMGLMTTCDPIEVAERTIRLQQELVKNGEKPRAAFAAIVEVARVQITSDTELTDDELKDAIRRKAPADKDARDLIEAAQKTLGSLITGENKWGVRNQNDAIIQAHDLLTTELAAMTRKEELLDLQAKAAAFGLSLSDEDKAEISEDDDSNVETLYSELRDIAA